MSSDNTPNNSSVSNEYVKRKIIEPIISRTENKDILIHLPLSEFQAGILIWLTSIGACFYVGIPMWIHDGLINTNFIALAGIMILILGIFILNDVYGYFKFPNRRKLRFIWK